MKLSDRAKQALSTCGIPEYMHGGIIRYYENGIPPGSFLEAVINNDLAGAAGRADDINRRLLWEYMNWFYNYPPSGTWGYPNAVNDWIKRSQEDADENARPVHQT